MQQKKATTSNGVTTTITTNYVGAFEEVATSVQTGSCSPCATSTATTKYYQAGPVTAESQGGNLYYLVNDDLGSVSVALTNAKTVQASQLFLPFGGSRYSSGSMPTSFGFTDQRIDPSGLNYFHARYYDASVGQFTSADSVQGPNRYAYVGGNPETVTDPTGHWGFDTLAAAVVGAVVGAAVGVATAVASGQPLTVDTVINIVTDTVLGSTGMVAATQTPGGFWGAAAATVAVAATNNGGKGFDLKGGGLESAFRQVAIGADAGAIGGMATEWVNGAAGPLASVGMKALANGAAQGFIAGAADFTGQVYSGKSLGQINWGETGLAS